MLQDLGQGRVGEQVQLGIGAVLDRVRDVDRRRIETEGVGLGAGGLDELGRGDEDGWAAFSLEVRRVVHTARRAGPSISEGFDHKVTLAEDLLEERPRRGPREGWLAEALDLRAPLIEQRFDAVEEDVATGLGDVEERDPQALDGGRPGDSLTGGGLALAGRVEDFETTQDFQRLTSTVTGLLPPPLGLTQLEMMPLNIPALPPAWTK